MGKHQSDRSASGGVLKPSPPRSEPGSATPLLVISTPVLPNCFNLFLDLGLKDKADT